MENKTDLSCSKKNRNSIKFTRNKKDNINYKKLNTNSEERRKKKSLKRTNFINKQLKYFDISNINNYNDSNTLYNNSANKTVKIIKKNKIKHSSYNCKTLKKNPKRKSIEKKVSINQKKKYKKFSYCKFKDKLNNINIKNKNTINSNQLKLKNYFKDKRNKFTKRNSKRSLSLNEKNNSFFNLKMINDLYIKRYSNSLTKAKNNSFLKDNISNPFKTYNYKKWKINNDKTDNKKKINGNKLIKSFISNNNNYFDATNINEDYSILNNSKNEIIHKYKDFKTSFKNYNYKPKDKESIYNTFLNTFKKEKIYNSMIHCHDKILSNTKMKEYKNKKFLKNNNQNTVKNFNKYLVLKQFENFSPRLSVAQTEKDKNSKNKKSFGEIYRKSLFEVRNKKKFKKNKRDVRNFYSCISDYNSDEKKINHKFNHLIFLIKSNWGNIIIISFNYIKILDKDYQEIPIINSNFDNSKKFVSKYVHGREQKLIIDYDNKKFIKYIEILNGLNDSGIKDLEIKNDIGKILWKGEVPKVNMLLNKPFILNLSNKEGKIYIFNVEKSSEKNINDKNEVKNTIKLKYQICDRIKIKLLENYGNSKYIGLSGIDLYDENDNIINIEENTTTININNIIENKEENKLISNLFNGINNSNDIRNMFIIKKENAFIDIKFSNFIKLKTIIIFNFNSIIYKTFCTKSISIEFYYNETFIKKIIPIFLYLPPLEENINFGQYLIYPSFNTFNLNKFNDLSKIIANKNIFNNDIIFNEEYNYYTPKLPCGYILKIEIMNNWGNNDFVGLNKIILYDENNKEISLSSKINSNEDDKSNYNKKFTRIYLLPFQREIKPDEIPIFLINYKRHNHIYNMNGDTRLYFIFNEYITISKIAFINYNKFYDMAVKDIKILLDGKVLFEGELKNYEINYIYFSKNNSKMSKSLINLHENNNNINSSYEIIKYKNSKNENTNNNNNNNNNNKIMEKDNINNRYNEFIQPNLKILSLK